MSKFYESLIRPAMFRLDAETAHELGMFALRMGLAPGGADRSSTEDRSLEIERFGLRFANPVGMAAGFDKNGVVVDQLAGLGFGFVEVGTVTLTPQKGNPKPRLFRLPEDKALINRLGFNNEGASAVAERLRGIKRRCIVGVNIGKNKDVPNEAAVENYLAAFDLVHDAADYIAVNISSPNTPGLRDLQQGESLEALLTALQARNRVLSSERVLSTAFRRPSRRGMPAKAGTQNALGTQNEKPVLVKIAPDLDDRSIEDIVETCIRLGVSGIIATNTTVSRDGLRTRGVDQIGAGGLSGRPLASRSNEIIRSIYRLANGNLPIIGVGGVFTAEDAFAKIAAGASLVQAYTGFIYQGPSFAGDISDGLRRIIKEKGFNSIEAAIGSSSSDSQAV